MDKLFYYELHHKIPADFRPGEVVGAGSFGRVVLLEDPAHPERKDFVIKEIFLEESKVKQNAKRLHVEVAILSALHHQHILQFYGCKFEKNKIWIFLPYMQKGSLKDYIEEKMEEIEEKCVEHMGATTDEQNKHLTKKYIEENGVLSEETTSLFTYQILKGLIYLHDNLIIHRDIKGANILLDQDLKIKLADFGISKILRNQTTNTSEMGTVKWMAPEISNEEPYDFKVDIWSVGATVVEMVTGSPPFPDQQPYIVILHMATNPTAEFRLPDAASKNLKSFLNSTFKSNPQERPTSRELIKEHFVAGDDKDAITDTEVSDRIKLLNGDLETDVTCEDEKNSGGFPLQTDIKCDKNVGHKDFIPIYQFSIQHLPPDYHDNELVQLVKALGNLTGLITIKFKEFVKCGTAKVLAVDKYTEGMEWGSYITCPCPECDHSDTPSKVWWEVEVVTAAHVVCESSELRQSSCRLWFDDDKSPVDKIYGWKAVGCKLDHETDRCVLLYVTHTSEIAEKLEKMVDLYDCINHKINDKYASRRDVDKLTIIVSHPHGCSKQVSVGHWIDREHVGDIWNRYYYTTATCPGCAGAYVYRLGYGTSTHVHSFCNTNKKLNVSSAGWM